MCVIFTRFSKLLFSQISICTSKLGSFENSNKGVSAHARQANSRAENKAVAKQQALWHK
jgi:hypothetical protein